MNEDLGDDDPWSYSFPTSTESLPLNDTTSAYAKVPGSKRGNNGNRAYHTNDTDVSKNQQNQHQNDGLDSGILDEDVVGRIEINEPHEEPVGSDDPENDLAILNEHLLKVQALHPPSTDEIDAVRNGLYDDESINSSEVPKELPSHPTSKTSSDGAIDIRKDVFNNGSASQSLNSLSLQSPFLKSMPANPLTTREDANSIISSQSSKNGLMNLDIHDDNDRFLESPKRPSTFLSNIRTGSNATISLENHKRTATDSDLNFIDQENTDDSPKSPKIIQYRRSRRTTSEGNFQEILESTINPKEKFDTKLYVEEKFKDTRYRYATIKRNTDFHQLFRSLDLTDRLLDDFACALSREILLQGRVYVSEHYICFNSSLLGWVTNLVIKQEDIVKFEKKNTAGIFPNGIAIETKDARHTFASFISRDSTLEFMISVWEGVTGKKMVIEDDSSDKSKIDDKSDEENEKEIESYIMTIDEDSTKVQEMNANHMVDSDSENGESTELRVIRFKKDSGYTNEGPDVHGATKIDEIDQIQDHETELYNDEIKAPLGVIYELLIGNKNGQFFNKILQTQGSSELNGYEALSEDDNGILQRSYTYKKSLGYSIGPKSTTCEVTETVKHIDFKRYVVFESVTKTPDVPSGNSFFVRTIFRLSWGGNSSTNLQMSYYIEWVGKSWIKSVIEKSTFTGQTDGCKDLINILNEEIESVCESTSKLLTESDKEDIATKQEPLPPKTSATHVVPPQANKSVDITLSSSNILIICLLLVMIFMIVNQIVIINRLSKLDTLLTMIIEKGS